MIFLSDLYRKRLFEGKIVEMEVCVRSMSGLMLWIQFVWCARRVLQRIYAVMLTLSVERMFNRTRVQYYAECVAR